MTQVKICGIRSAEHAIVAAEAGAQFIGIVFAASRRQVSPQAARALLREARQASAAIGRDTKVVGVFVNASAAEMNEVASLCGLDYLQLNGDESLDLCNQLQRPVLKAVRIDPSQPLEQAVEQARQAIRELRRHGHLPLLDCAATGAYGGAGQAFDWRVAEALDGLFLLAGGLTPENVGDAVRRVRPWGVDVSSGVETGGVKDSDKIHAFLSAVRQVEALRQV